jgi:hypothetical protein
MQEEWRPVVGFPDYEVSSLGRVRRAVDGYRKRAGQFLAQRIVTGGYPAVWLGLDGVGYTKTVHSLVCAAFHGPRPSRQHQVAHNNGMPDDNRAENLRWATPRENRLDCVAHGTMPLGEAHYRAGLTVADVQRIMELRSRPQRPGALKISKELGLPFGAVSGVVHGASWAHITGGTL